MKNIIKRVLVSIICISMLMDANLVNAFAYDGTSTGAAVSKASDIQEDYESEEDDENIASSTDYDEEIAATDVIDSESGWSYVVLADNTLRLTKFTGDITEAEFTIPAEVDEKPVSTVAANFAKNSGLTTSTSAVTSLIISEGITTLETYSFTNCANLESVHFPDSLITINLYAFSNCSKLSTINYPVNITTPEDFNYKYYKGKVFDGCAIRQLEIPEGVTEIIEYIFSDLDSLYDITLPSSLTSIKKGAFYDCDGLKSITIPENVIDIDEEAFYKCNSLEEVNITSSLTRIGSEAFYNCSSLEEITIPDSVETIGYQAFAYNYKLKKINYPSSLKTIEAKDYGVDGNVFIGDTLFTSITIPEDVKKIPKYAYMGSSLKHVIMPEGLETIDSSSFANCSSLINIYIPDSVTSIAPDAFKGSGAVTIYCNENSYAHTYAVDKGINYSFDPIKLGDREASGTIIDSEGEGIPGVSIYVWCYEEANAVGWYKTDIDGKWSCKEFEDGNKYRITYYHRDYKFDKSVFDIVIGEEYDVDAVGSILEGEYTETPKEELTYKLIDGNNIAITGYSGSSTTVVIPASIDGHNVTEVGDTAFRLNKDIERVIFPDSMRRIGVQSFYGCKNLSDIRYNVGLTTIDDSAFMRCSAISTPNMPNTLNYIGPKAFNECIGISSLYIPDSVKSVRERAFYGCSELSEINYPVDIKNNTDEFDLSYNKGEIFALCPKLTTVSIQEGIKSIAPYYYGRAKSITSVTLPESLETIDAGVFYECESLESIDIPSKVHTIGQNSFVNCISLNELNLSDDLLIIGKNAFLGCKAIKTVSIPDSVTTIDFQAFANCTSLIKINYPLNLDQAKADKTDYYYKSTGIFSGCTSLKTVSIPYGVKSIAPHVFKSAPALEYIAIPQSVTEIGSNCFQNCTKLAGITLPDSVDTISNYAFSGCKALESVKASSIKSIGQEAFSNCISLTTINAGLDNLSTIDNKAFYNCSELLSMRITENLTKQGTNVFTNCNKLTLYIPRYTKGMTNAIDGKLNVLPTSEERYEKWSDLLETDGCLFRTNYDSGSKNGLLNFTLDYSVKSSEFAKAIKALSKPTVNIYIPNDTEVVDGSVRLNGRYLTSTDYSINNSLMSIKVTDAQGKITFNVKRNTSSSKIISYATFSAWINSESKINVIDVLIDNVDVITIEAAETVSTGSIPVYGYAAPGEKVNLYIENRLVDTVTTNKAGYYEALLSIDNPIDNYTYKICAELDSQKEYSAVCIVSYASNLPQIKLFKMIYKGKEYDLLQSNIGIIANNPYHPYSFDIGFDNVEKVKDVYVVSRRNNAVKKIKAEWDDELKIFVIRDKKFAEDKTGNIPGTISVEFSTNNNLILSLDDAVTLVEQLQGEAEEESKYTDNYTCEETPITDGSGAFEGIDDVKGTEYVLESEDSESGDDYKLIVREETVTIPDIKPGPWPGPGVPEPVEISLERISRETGGRIYDSGNGYRAVVDTRNPYVQRIYVEDKKGSTIEQFTIEVLWNGVAVNVLNDKFQTVLSEIFGEESVGSLFNQVGAAFFAKDILSNLINYEDLVNDIEASNMTESQKKEALKQAEDLYLMRMATTTLFFVIGLSGPALPVAILLSITSIFLDELYNQYEDYLRTGQASGIIKWLIDPSGYVYDIVTGDRLLGVKATVYCVLSDGEDPAFWDNPPGDGDGEIWNASEYSQLNPLYTDIEGWYAWDVPEGWWKVTYELDGYNLAESEWLPVPPPQVDVNVGLTPKSRKLTDGVYSYTSIDPQVYTGSKICPGIDLEYDGRLLQENKDYKLSYKNNINVGKAILEVNGIGDFTKKLSIEFDIIPKSLGDDEDYAEGVSVSVLDKSHTGKLNESKPVVKFGKITLKDKIDYSYEFSGDTVEPGEVIVKIKGKGNYTGTITSSYRIYNKTEDFSKLYFEPIPNQEYTGSSVEPQVLVKTAKSDGTTVTTDCYYVRYENNLNAGTATAIVIGKGDYKSYGNAKKLTFKINPKTIKNATINVTGYTYTGTAIKPTVEVIDSDTEEVIPASCYSVAYSNTTDVPAANALVSKKPTIKITGKKNYKDSVSTTFTISQLTLIDNMGEPIDGLTITVPDVKEGTKAVTLNDIKPVIKYGKKTLTKGKDYTLAFTRDENQQMQTATITFIGNYCGSIDKQFMVFTSQKKVAELDVSLNQDTYTYTGQKIIPSVTVKTTIDGIERTLVEGRDYKIAASNNTNAADATAKSAPSVKITGTGAYTGSSEALKFTIEKKELTKDDIIVTVEDAKYTKNAVKPKVKIIDKASGKAFASANYTIAYSNNVDLSEIGENGPKALISGKGNYKTEEPLEYDFRIYEIPISGMVFEKIANVEYSGKQITPSGDDVVIYKSREKTVANKLTEAEDYVLTYDTNIKAGTGKVYVTGAGKYGGTKTVTFMIVPKWLKWLLL